MFLSLKNITVHTCRQTGQGSVVALLARQRDRARFPAAIDRAAGRMFAGIGTSEIAGHRWGPCAVT
jgi:hypothetical protein